MLIKPPHKARNGPKIRKNIYTPNTPITIDEIQDHGRCTCTGTADRPDNRPGQGGRHSEEGRQAEKERASSRTARDRQEHDGPSNGRADAEGGARRRARVPEPEQREPAFGAGAEIVP